MLILPSSLLCLLALTADEPTNLAPMATAEASSAASPSGGKYAPEKAIDGSGSTHWASADGFTLPTSLTLRWPQAVRFDVVVLNVYAAEIPNLYSFPQSLEVEAAGQTVQAEVPDGNRDLVHLRFAKVVESDTLTVRITAIHGRRSYLGLNELAVYFDPAGKLQPPPPMVHPMARDDLVPTGRAEHPCVYYSRPQLDRARRNATETEWGKRVRDQLITTADSWLERSDDEWAQFLPAPGACYAYGFTGSPRTGHTWGTWGGARCDWEHPGQVKVDDEYLPNEPYPDDGAGYHNPDGRVHYFVGSWNAWVTEQWLNAAVSLAHAYALTGDEKYADRAALFLDLSASIYPESTSGSWDYPSSPPSGRFARPWYQVSRTLVRYIEAYDLLYHSPAFDQPSRRPALEAARADGPSWQQTAVGTPDAKGFTKPGLTRRENLEVNLVQDGAYYCYSHTFSGALHNGHADYLRGALAAGALLGIPEYIRVTVDGPYSFWSMVANNSDRDGRYYETSLGYAIHARNLYLTYVEPLRNWRDAAHPDGYDLLSDPRFRSFYRLPSAVMDCAGHSPNFGDSAPDTAFMIAPDQPYEPDDHRFAEWVYAHGNAEVKRDYAAVLRWLANGNVDAARSRIASTWLLYNAEPVPDGPRELPPAIQRYVHGSWALGQKGMAILRDGEREQAQAVLLRYGPSLNHGDLDDLGLLYYANGRQLTYDIGYGLGSTHTHVGWASQTVSHCLVTVNEASQHGGSGGSLYLFGRLPGLRVVEADSPLSYADQQVSEYRRTVALIGTGEEQVLVDLFRVTGGHQHDYGVGVASTEVEVDGVAFGPPESGSLAEGVAWGKLQGPDGDLVGYPNKPYWNPPPRTGYGFFYDPRRSTDSNPWRAVFSLGGPLETKLDVRMLPQPGSQAILAKAPGLYPRNPHATYAIVRRTGAEGLKSVFATVMAPYAKRLPPTYLGPANLATRVIDSNRSTVLGSGYEGYLFLRGQEAGDYLTVRLDVAQAGEYDLLVHFLRYPSYGTVQVSLDDHPVGPPLSLAGEAQPWTLFELGRHQLPAGEHRLKVTVMPGDGGKFFGLQRVTLRAAGADTTAEEQAIATVSGASRLTVQSEDSSAVAVLLGRRDADEILLSAGPSAQAAAIEEPLVKASWRGGVALLRLRERQPVAAGLVGCGYLRTPALSIEPSTAAYTGQVTRVDRIGNVIETTARLPVTGLEGEEAIFNRPEYSRTSGYRIERIEATPTGSKIHLGSQSLLLGKGRVFDLPGGNVVLSDIPHDYARSVVGGGDDGFFNGKLVTSSGGQTLRLRRIVFEQPMRLEFEAAGKLQRGETLSYWDLGEGDSFTIPTSVWVEQTKDGWRVTSTAAAHIKAPGQEAVEVPATGIGQATRLR